jgi:MFS family permease
MNAKPEGNRSSAKTVVILLSLAIFINALDRGNFSTAAPLIKGDLKLSNAQIGILISAFFWTYVPGHALTGWLIDKLGAYRTLAIGVTLWSLATFFTGFAGGFVTLLLLRLLLGLAESTAFPVSSKLLALYIPHDRLASANAWNGVGLMMGNGAGIFIGGMLIVTLGWHALFFIFGAVSLLWLVPWLRVKPPEPIQSAPDEPDHAPSFAEMLGKREMWGAMIGHFCGNYSYFVVLSWLPLFLVKQQGFSISAMAWLGGAVYLIASVVGLVGARMTDRVIAAGSDVGRIRKQIVLASGVIALVCMLLCATGRPMVAVAGLLLYGVANGLGFFSLYSIGQTLAGPRAAGKWVGLQNGFAGLSGVISPIVTGYSIDATGDYRVAFLVAAMVAVVGMAVWLFVVRKVEQIAWSVD